MEKACENCAYQRIDEDASPCDICSHRYRDMFREATCAICVHKDVCKFDNKDGIACKTYFKPKEAWWDGNRADAEDD